MEPVYARPAFSAWRTTYRETAQLLEEFAAALLDDPSGPVDRPDHGWQSGTALTGILAQHMRKGSPEDSVPAFVLRALADLCPHGHGHWMRWCKAEGCAPVTDGTAQALWNDDLWATSAPEVDEAGAVQG